MPSRQQVAQALGAFGAGVQGRGPEFIQQLDENRKQALLEDAFSIQQALQAGDTSTARLTLVNRLQAIQQLGGDPSDTDSLLLDIERGDTDKALQRVTAVVDFGFRSGRLVDPRTSVPAATRAFESLTSGLTPEDEKKAVRIKLGLDPRAVGSAEQTITAQDIVNLIAGTRRTLSSATEEGKLGAQLKLKPAVESAVAGAVAGAEALADQAVLAKSNEATFNVYEVGMGGLIASLDETFTGPFVASLPALTANAQAADGAVAAMAPVLKQMFRAAGEGIFTDKDQELLIKMIPTRDDLPVARLSKLTNIDAIVRAKLGIQLQAAPSVSDGLPEGFEGLSPEDQELVRQHLSTQ